MTERKARGSASTPGPDAGNDPQTPKPVEYWTARTRGCQVSRQLADRNTSVSRRFTRPSVGPNYSQGAACPCLLDPRRAIEFEAAHHCAELFSCKAPRMPHSR